MKRKLNRILRIVAGFYGLKPRDVIKRDRHGLEVKARQMFHYIGRILGYSHDETARAVARDRTTAIYHYYVIRDEVDTREPLLFNEETNDSVNYLLDRCSKFKKL